ncbi:Kazal-type serine protease inhibitor family protein [Algoriphagus marinus]|uniref:Kazal-type serine protease inhibitor domain-containing protein n=1 Tax=Algoriphagus marinus TaxID=1925762 RepID=UPI00094BBDDA|nr:Kazal-type serine protease inhibitor domain-containing protein [Algoriphagus marinus]
MKKLSFFVFLLISISAFQCEDQKPIDDCIDPEKIRTGICTTDYNPVCGCDLKTYSNACSADLAGVKSWTLGECK